MIFSLAAALAVCQDLNPFAPPVLPAWCQKWRAVK